MPLIDIKKLRTDGGTQHGGRNNEATIAEYTEAYLDDKKLPPVKAVFDGEHHWLWDGFTRVEAAKAAGKRGISVEITRGTLDDAFDLSGTANTDHGLRRSLENKKSVVLAFLANERHAFKSDREISRLCGVSHGFVAGLRNPESVVVKARAEAKTGKAGKAKVTNGKQNPSVTAGDPTAPGDTTVTKPKATPIAVEAVVRERDELLGKVIEMGGELERAVAEIRVLEDALQLGDAETALRNENALLRKNYSDLEARFNGLMSEKAAAIKSANHWRQKAKEATVQ